MKTVNLKVILSIFFGIVSNLSLSQSYLDVNNIKALINYEGSFFWDYKTDTKGYEVPKGSNKHTIFASTLWIGGYDAGNNLHEAAQTYRQNGTDFWAGPLNILNLSTDTAGWQKTWKINKSEIDSHRINYNKIGYNIPLAIQNWPANGTGGFSKVLAPYVDVDSNQIYNPQAGDFPYIFGDQAVYFIMNDSFSKHEETKGLPLGIEIHTMAYAFKSDINDVSLDNTIFVRYEIKNRTNQNYHDVYAGIWTDFDIGYAFDDYIGSDSSRNMYFGYNGDSIDQGIIGYGTNPPLQAIKFLNLPMSHYMYYNNDFTPSGNPSKDMDYYNYLSGKFKNGQRLRYGGDGFNNVWDATKFSNYMFPADPRQPIPAWSEASSDNFPGDRRGLGSIGPVNLKAGELLTLDIAYIYVREQHPNYLDAFDDLNTNSDKIQQLYDQGKITNPYQAGINDKTNKLVMNLYPNPMESYSIISFNNPFNKVFSLQITDLYGKIIYQNHVVKTDKVKIERNDMKPGLYIITLCNKNFKGQIKLIVR